MSSANSKSSYGQLIKTAENRRLLEQELLVVEATELVCDLLEKNRISRAELARRIGKSKAFVSQILSGSRNMTLRTLADLAWALDARIQLRPARDLMEEEAHRPPRPLLGSGRHRAVLGLRPAPLARLRTLPGPPSRN